MRPESSPPRSSAFLTRRARKTVCSSCAATGTPTAFAEIGKLLGITEGNARLRLTRMRKQLKTYLTEQEVLV